MVLLVDPLPQRFQPLRGGHGLLVCHKLIVILMVGVVVDFDWGFLRPMDVEEVLRP